MLVLPVQKRHIELAERGIKVNLIEMRPVKQTPAHHTDKFAELVCSNSLRGNALTNGVGVLKEEMRRLNSIIIEAADKAQSSSWWCISS